MATFYQLAALQGAAQWLTPPAQLGPLGRLRFVTRTLGKIICATWRIKMEPAALVPRQACRTRVWKKTTHALAGWPAVTRNTRAPFQSIPVSAINLYLDCAVGGGRGRDVNKTGQPDILYISAASKCQDEVPLAGTWQISCRPLRPDCGSGFICLSMCEGGVRDEKFGGPSPSMLFSGPSAVTPRPPGRLLERHREFISCKAFFFFLLCNTTIRFSLWRSIGGEIEQRLASAYNPNGGRDSSDWQV